MYNVCHTIQMRFTGSKIKKIGEDSADSSVYSQGSNSLLTSFVSKNYQSSVCAHCRHKASFLEDLLDTKTTYHKPYRSLSLWERVKRKQRVTKEILAACIIDAEQLKKDQYGYLHSNKVLAIDCLNFIDRVKNGSRKSFAPN